MTPVVTNLASLPPETKVMNFTGGRAEIFNRHGVATILSNTHDGCRLRFEDGTEDGTDKPSIYTCEVVVDRCPPAAAAAGGDVEAVRRQLRRARELLVIAERDGMRPNFHRHGESNAARRLRDEIAELLARRVP